MSTTVEVEGIGSVEVTVTERGRGEPILLLHGGAGPLSVVAWAELMARTHEARVITPIHPGFMGTPRPEALRDIGGLARLYAALLRQLGLDGATVIGNSVGGWIAPELALHAPELVRRLVIIDGAGIAVPGHPVPDVFNMPFAELSRLSYHDPARFAVDPSKLTAEQRALVGKNLAALELYAGDMMDPGLRARLAQVSAPTLVVWGESDRVVDVAYGQAYAQAIPGARFELLAGAGHLPQLETPERLADTVWRFIAD